MVVQSEVPAIEVVFFVVARFQGLLLRRLLDMGRDLEIVKVSRFHDVAKFLSNTSSVALDKEKIWLGTFVVIR